VYDESKLISSKKYKEKLAKGKLKGCIINPKYSKSL